ncbi:hypothetical protein DEU56DRAFT_830738 [Suillus clintonianus]|uniref:uncharacterized protein n=1 Tax=Suillus clintonianus TaxID=1904413 RepID=UPI001B860DFF|nr:uncharacterized protein DEU56DRAFT_830738 [Suillus clintonianus]KAG2123076.1 hypothetical protein DEU56DRAFT_830738 [Suillus clintonianus]
MAGCSLGGRRVTSIFLYSSHLTAARRLQKTCVQTTTSTTGGLWVLAYERKGRAIKAARHRLSGINGLPRDVVVVTDCESCRLREKI